MKITIENKAMKKEVLKALREFKQENIYMFFNFEKDENNSIENGILRIQLSKTYYGNLIFHNLEYNFKVEHNYNIKKLVIQDQNKISVLFQMLLENEYFINCYAKNLINIKLGDPSNSCDYWIDTIDIKNIKRNKELKHDQLSFNNSQMIYLNN